MYDGDAVCRRFYDDLFERASSLVAKGKVHPPIVVMLDDAGTAIAVLTSEMGADERAALFKKMAAYPQAQAAALITESWYMDATRNPAEATRFLELASEGRLHECPDKKEAIVISILTPMRQAIMVCHIDRTTHSVQKAPFKWVNEESHASYTGRYVRSTQDKLN